MREQLEVGVRRRYRLTESASLAAYHAVVAGLACVRLLQQYRLFQQLLCTRLQTRANSQDFAGYSAGFARSKAELSRNMSLSVGSKVSEVDTRSVLGRRASAERSGLSAQCERFRADQADQLKLSGHRSRHLFQSQKKLRKTSTGCENLKQFADSARDESKQRSWIAQVDNNYYVLHDFTRSENAVSGSETKFFLDSYGQRNYYDRKFSRDNSVSTVSAFFHLQEEMHHHIQVKAGLSSFRLERSASGRVVSTALCFVRLKEAESRKRRRSPESAINM